MSQRDKMKIEEWLEKFGECWPDDRSGSDAREMVVAAERIIRSLIAQVKEAEAYKLAIDDALIVCCNQVASGDAKMDLHKLLCYEIEIALDPRVSEKAALLVKEVRRQAFEDAIKCMDDALDDLSIELRRKAEQEIGNGGRVDDIAE